MQDRDELGRSSTRIFGDEAGQGASFLHPKCFSIGDGIRHPRFFAFAGFLAVEDVRHNLIFVLHYFFPSGIIEVTRARIQEFATPFVKFRSQPFVGATMEMMEVVKRYRGERRRYYSGGYTGFEWFA
jgi:hypothetical protein